MHATEQFARDYGLPFLHVIEMLLPAGKLDLLTLQ